MTIVQTVLVYGVIPAVVVFIFAALTLWPKGRKSARYRSGDDWEHAPVWWSANPDGVPGQDHVDAHRQAVEPKALGSRALGSHGLGNSTQPTDGTVAEVVGGGARGTW